MTKTRRELLAAALLAASAAGLASTLAFDPKSTSPVNIDGKGLALRGTDPVSYFADGKPARGTAAFQSQWQGTTYQFATADNKTVFDKDPARYAPQYGGFCAWAASQGYKADADPAAWKVVDGKLYVNYNADVGKTWAANAPAFIIAGDANWSKVQSQPRK